MDLYPIEARLINWMIADHPVLRAQLPHLRIAERQPTGKGFFLLFEPVPKKFRCNELKDVLSAVISTNLPSPRDIVGFSLFIADGAITSFEGYTFGSEAWPAASMESWLSLEELALTEPGNR